MKRSVHCDGMKRMSETGCAHRSPRGRAAWVAGLAAFGVCLSATVASAQTVSPVVMSQVTLLAAFGSGGALAGGGPSGSSMAVDASGNLIVSNTYGNQILEFKPGGTAATTLGSFTDPGGVAIDPAGNLYLSNSTNGTIVKIPVSGGTYAAISNPSSSTPACTGGDTAECTMPTALPVSGVVGMIFDASGDLFVTSTAGATNPNSVIECTAACLSTGTPAPAVLFAESTTPTTEGSSSATYYLGGIAIDKWGDVFFTDSLMDATNGASGESYAGDLQELVYSGNAYSSTVTTLATLTDSSPGTYDNQLDGVAVDANGVVYYATQYDGIFAFPNNAGVVNTTTKYMMSTQGAKILTTDGKGDFYVASYSSAAGGDAGIEVGIGALTATAAAVGTPSNTTNITTILNDEGCSPTPTVNFTASTSEFSAATTGSCSTVNGTGASFATTLTFTPAYGGTRTGVLTATEAGGSGSSGTANVSGFATGAVAPPSFSPTPGTYTSTQTVTLSDSSSGATIYYTTDGSTPTTSSMVYSGPITVSTTTTINAIATATGASTSTEATGTYTLPAATPTFTPAPGVYATGQSVTIADATSGATIYYTTDGTTPTTSSAVYSGAIPITANTVLQAIAAASGLPNSAVASGTYLLSSATTLPLSVVMNQQTTWAAYPAGGALGGGSPAGNSVGVDSNGDLFTGTAYGNTIVEFSATTGAATTLGSISNPGPVAVDKSNNIYIGLTYGGQVVKVPLVSGTYAAISAPSGTTPTCTGSDTAECVLPTLSSGISGGGLATMIFDAAGDLYFSTTNGSTTPNAIYECNVACLGSSSPSATLIYTEPTSSAPTTAGQLMVGGLAVDSFGDLFFTDAAQSTSTSEEAFSSNLKELVYTSGTGYATTPTVLYTYTNTSPAQYDDELDGVAVDQNNVVYFATQNEGIFAFSNSNGSVSTAKLYQVSTQGGKVLTTDGKGDFYVATYISGDTAVHIAIGVLTAPEAALGGTSTISGVSTILNDVACSASPTVTFEAEENGASTTEFSAATSGSCSSTYGGGAAFPTTVTFAPTGSGSRTATLTGVDSAGGIGTAMVTGITSGTVAATPAFSVPAGTYTSVQTVTITDGTAGATIYYTTDGSTPTTASALYSGPVSISSTETLQAIAAATGLTNSAVASAAYTINLPAAATPTISVPGGTYNTTQSVTLADTTAGASIFYTLDGSTPTTSSSLYTKPITISSSETLNAIAGGTNFSSSPVATAAYNLVVAAPALSVAAGTYTTIQTVAITDTTTGASIYYTLDGSTPTSSSTLYTGPITVGVSETINAIGIENGFTSSSVASAAYTINLPPAATPMFSVSAGTYSTPQTVVISDSTSGATIYYTTDGSTPTTSSPVFAAGSTGIVVVASETINAMAVATGYVPSAEATAAYTINLPPPTFTLAINPKSITIPSGVQFQTAQMTVSQVNSYSAPITLSCSGAPSGTTCGLSTQTVTLPIGSPYTGSSAPYQPTSQVVQITISRNAVVSELARPRTNPLLPGATLALALCFFGFRKRRGLQIALLVVISVLGMSMISGCGSSSPSTGSGTVTVTAKSGAISQTATLSVSMQ
jgi:hypothetical protein